jgi:hypothetical protein
MRRLVVNRWAFLVGIEKPLHAELGVRPYAEADVKAWADALEVTGVPRKNQIHLAGAYATKTAIESRLRWLKKQVKKDDTLLVFWSGPGHADEEPSVLDCWDTLPTDRSPTGLILTDLLDTFAATKASQIIYFLSVSGIREKDLEEHFDCSAKAAALIACSAGEEPRTTPAIKLGVWSELVAEAISGRARKAATNRRVTALSLQRYIEGELPRRLRKHFEGGLGQTPVLLGGQNTAAMVVELPAGTEADESVLDAARLRRIVFRSETTSRVRDLMNFRKTYSVPDNAGPGNRKFVQRIATDDIRAELDRVFQQARDLFGYKRKDVTLTVGQDGTGSVRTPDFEFTVYLDLDVDDPSQVVLRREVGQFVDADFVRRPEFQSDFGASFDQLVFEFAKPLDVAAFIDRLEDAPPPGVKLTIGGDGKSCEVAIAGFAGSVVVKRSAVLVRGRGGNAAGLLDLFLQFLGRVGPLGDPPALPAAT